MCLDEDFAHLAPGAGGRPENGRALRPFDVDLHDLSGIGVEEGRLREGIFERDDLY